MVVQNFGAREEESSTSVPRSCRLFLTFRDERARPEPCSPTPQKTETEQERETPSNAAWPRAAEQADFFGGLANDRGEFSSSAKLATPQLGEGNLRSEPIEPGRWEEASEGQPGVVRTAWDWR
jgi:hypothetical protein